MLQFYFLSIALNLISGLTLVFEDVENTAWSFFKSKTAHLVLGIITFATGFFKLISVIRGIPVFGDLFPALFGLLAGFTLLLEYYQAETTNGLDNKNAFFTFFIIGKKYIGVGTLIFAVLHFFFPQIMLL